MIGDWSTAVYFRWWGLQLCLGGLLSRCLIFAISHPQENRHQHDSRDNYCQQSFLNLAHVFNNSLRTHFDQFAAGIKPFPSLNETPAPTESCKPTSNHPLSY